MGEVIALRSRPDPIYRTARRTAWKSLTPVERVYVRVVERDRRLFELFDGLMRDYYMTGWFVIPTGYSKFEVDALNAMRRFVDELSYLMAELREAKEFVDDYNIHSQSSPA